MNISPDRLKPFIDADGRLKALPAKKSVRMPALRLLAARFEPSRRYTESEVNGLINQATAFRDPATLRRELFNNGFIGRERDGSAYWLEENQPTDEELGL